MELREYLLTLKKNAFAILTFAIVGSLISLFFVAKIPQGVRFEQLLYIVTPRENSGVYRYEGYYAQEKARNFTDTAVAILESPDFAEDVLSPSAQIAVRKVAPQVVRLTVTGPDPQIAKKAFQEATDGFNLKMVSLSGEDQAFKIQPVGSQPQEILPSFSKPVAVVFGFLLGSLFALFVVGLKTYFRL